MTRNPAEGKQKMSEKEKREGIFQQHHKQVKDRAGFILAQISDLISPQERFGGTNPSEYDERLALTLHYLATGESFQSLSFQCRITLNAVSYIIKGCCKAIVERIASAFVKVPSTKAE